MSMFLSWLWQGAKPQYKNPTDAAHDPSVRDRFRMFLDTVEPPDSFKASEVAQSIPPVEIEALGYEKWEEVMPAIKELAFELRELGDCEIIKGGKVLPESVGQYDIEGGFRIRRTQDMEFEDTTFSSREAWLT